MDCEQNGDDYSYVLTPMDSEGDGGGHVVTTDTISDNIIYEIGNP